MSNPVNGTVALKILYFMEANGGSVKEYAAVSLEGF